MSCAWFVVLLLLLWPADNATLAYLPLTWPPEQGYVLLDWTTQDDFDANQHNRYPGQPRLTLPALTSGAVRSTGLCVCAVGDCSASRPRDTSCSSTCRSGSCGKQPAVCAMALVDSVPVARQGRSYFAGAADEHGQEIGLACRFTPLQSLFAKSVFLSVVSVSVVSLRTPFASSSCPVWRCK